MIRWLKSVTKLFRKLHNTIYHLLSFVHGIKCKNVSIVNTIPIIEIFCYESHRDNSLTIINDKRKSKICSSPCLPTFFFHRVTKFPINITVYSELSRMIIWKSPHNIHNFNPITFSVKDFSNSILNMPGEHTISVIISRICPIRKNKTLFIVLIDNHFCPKSFRGWFSTFRKLFNLIFIGCNIHPFRFSDCIKFEIHFFILLYYLYIQTSPSK